MYGLTKIPQRNFNLIGDVDGLFADFFPPLQRGVDAPALDIVETGGGYEVTVDLPGVSKDDLSVNIKDNVLTIDAEIRSARERKDTAVITSERRTGKLRRALRLGRAIDENKVTADYHDGVLKLQLPHAAHVEGRKVEIKAH